MASQNMIVNGFVQLVHKFAAIFFIFLTRDPCLQRRKTRQRDVKCLFRVQVHRRDNFASRTRKVRDHGFVMTKAFFADIAWYAHITTVVTPQVERVFTISIATVIYHCIQTFKVAFCRLQV